MARELVTADVDVVQAQFTPGTIAFGAVAPILTDSSLYFGLTVSGTVGRSYRIEFADQPNAQTWSPAGTLVLTNASQLWLDISGPAQAKRFYRAVQVP